jgi:hypothetical protein
MRFVVIISTSTETPKFAIKQAFKKDETICMVCGKRGFRALKRHLGQAHDLKPGQYRKLFGISSSQSLAAKNYFESHRQTALDNGLGEGLAKSRGTSAAKKAAVPMKTTKAPIPAVKTNAPVTAVRKKVAVPANVANKKLIHPIWSQ